MPNVTKRDNDIREKRNLTQHSYEPKKNSKEQNFKIKILLPREFLAKNIQNALTILDQLQQDIDYQMDINDINIFKEIIHELHTLRIPH